MAETSKQLHEVVRRMNESDSRDRLAAREELTQMGPVAVTHLIADLRRVPPVRKKLSMLIIGVRILALPVLVLIGLVLLLAATDGLFGFSDFGLFDGWNPRRQYHERLHKRQWNQSICALTQLDDMRVAGPLIEALQYADAWTQPLILDALARLLPHLPDTDARALTSLQRQALYRWLATNHESYSGRNSTLYLSMLNVLVRAEDVQALSVVAIVSRQAKLQEIQEAACSALAQLQAIAVRQQSSQSLLRGASAPVTPADMLLKPAYGNASADPQQLLRAGSTPDSPG